MATRFYPRYVKGNPQLRVFLPDWKLIMIKPPERLPSNIVLFKTDPRMTDWDIKNYLEKIYKVQIAGLRSRIFMGDLKSSKKGLTKKDDYKITHVTLASGQIFKWPDLFPEDKSLDQDKDNETSIKELSKDRKIQPDQVGLPTWFT